MKRFTVFLCTMTLVLGLVGAAQAIPMYYTFQGTVNNFNNNSSIPGTFPAIGDTVTYYIEVDRNVIGTQTTFGGATTNYTIYPSYYTDYIGGYTDSALPEPTNPIYSAASQIAEYNYGYIIPNGRAYINTGSMNNLLQLYADGSGTPDMWDANTAITASQRYWTTAGFVNVYAKLTLTNRSGTNPLINPVPEPATMLLLGTGLVGLAGFGRKKFLKKMKT